MNINENLVYAQGALAAKEYLHKAQMDMKVNRRFQPQTLRLHKEAYLKDKAPEFQAGFMDAIGAFILSSLDGGTVDLFRWDVLSVLQRANRKK
ncbi:hypothetical protein [Ralstonia sp. UNC404CL21Col]|uniref:hypothetical protein n=1 Tax=Ralstonia sp. UNC404CL21Col TaxID=1380362 RepID=UPI0004850768|nr:hypothetical protein [Ralstonia sp. UNC404CL21Col]